MAPTTFIVLLAVGVGLIIGALLLRSGSARRDPGRVCRDCAHENEASARFCARCGQKL